MHHFTLDELRARLAPRLERRHRTALALEGFRRAAVLVPLVASAAYGSELLLTRRTETVETHKGQISFPGGMADAADAGVEATALREAHEELDLPPSSVEVWGLLDDLATPTGFVITPVVGAIAELPPLVPNPGEVAEVLAVPLGFFADPRAGRMEEREVRGVVREVWYYHWKEAVVWGATAAMIRSLLTTGGLFELFPPQTR